MGKTINSLKDLGAAMGMKVKTREVQEKALKCRNCALIWSILPEPTSMYAMASRLSRMPKARRPRRLAQIPSSARIKLTLS
jgi:hypothetical protein